ncbi:MAG: BT_3928 family protein [Bacteroidales bacterium]
MKITAYISRFLLGIVFIYSGFVKAVDPWGSQFKFEDYLIAFGMEWLMPAALLFSIMLSAAEFLIGFAFLFAIKPKLSVWSAIAFMALFTPITLWLALTDAVPDCGCFGDALILTNWQTFYKNIAIDILLIPVFLYRKKFGHYMSCKLEWVPVLIISAGILFTSFYGMRHLPVVDFLPYKSGLSMKPDSTMKDKYFVSYKDKVTGETKEYPADDFPWDDTTWMANNEFVSQRIEPGPKPANLIVAFDAEGTDVTKDVILNPEFQFLVVSYNMENMTDRAIEKLNSLAAECEKDSIAIAMLTGSEAIVAEKVRHDKQIPVDVYFSDDISLKMFIRNNPGFVLMKDGSILDRWAWRDLPALKDIDLKGLEQKFLKK